MFPEGEERDKEAENILIKLWMKIFLTWEEYNIQGSGNTESQSRGIWRDTHQAISQLKQQKLNRKF